MKACNRRRRPRVVLLGLMVVMACSTLGAAEYRVTDTFHLADQPGCMPALTRAPNGDLLVAYSTEWEPFPAGGVLKLVVSHDNGATWSKPRILWKDKDPRVTIQVSNGLATLTNGDVLLPVTYCVVPRRKGVGPDETNPSVIYDFTVPGYRRETRLLRSNDSGLTWTIEEPDLPKRQWRFGRLLETKDGRLIMTGMGWYFESRDFGRTWSPKIRLAVDRFSSETNIIQATDGTLVSIVRGGGGLPRRTFGTNFSRDGGKIWSLPRSARVQGKMPDLLVLPSGRILLVVGAEGLTDGSQIFTKNERNSFCTLFVSDDHGQSWKRDVALAQAAPGGSVVPADSPVLWPLDDRRVLVVMQGIDRAKKDDPLVGFSAGMSLLANVIEPVEP